MEAETIGKFQRTTLTAMTCIAAAMAVLGLAGWLFLAVVMSAWPQEFADWWATADVGPRYQWMVGYGVMIAAGTTLHVWRLKRAKALKAR